MVSFLSSASAIDGRSPVTTIEMTTWPGASIPSVLSKSGRAAADRSSVRGSDFSSVNDNVAIGAPAGETQPWKHYTESEP